MNASRLILRGLLLLGLGLTGLGCSKGTDTSEEKEKKGNIVGTWEPVKIESFLGKFGVGPGDGTWEFTGGGHQQERIWTIKTLTDKEMIVDKRGTLMSLKRKGTAPTGKTNKEKIVGTWTAGDEFWDFNKEGNFKYGGIARKDRFPDEKPGTLFDTSRGSYKLDSDKLWMTEKGDGKLSWKGKRWETRCHYQIKGDKLTTIGLVQGPNGIHTWTIKELTDDKLVLVDQKGNTDEYKRRGSEPAKSNAELIVGTWEVVENNGAVAFGANGSTVTFTRDGKLKKSNGTFTYKINGDKLTAGEERTEQGGEVSGEYGIKTLTDDTLALSFSPDFAIQLKKKSEDAALSKADLLIGEWFLEKSKSWSTDATMDFGHDGILIGATPREAYFYKFKVEGDEIKLSRTVDDGPQTWTIKEASSDRLILLVKDEDNAPMELRKGRAKAGDVSPEDKVRGMILGSWEVPATKEFPVALTYEFTKSIRDNAYELFVSRPGADGKPQRVASMTYLIGRNKISVARKEGTDNWELLHVNAEELIFKDHRGTRMNAKKK